jgi:phosphoribosylanthranilate isomerase
MTRVKICGVTDPRDRDVAVGADADAVGVISDVTVDTPREVDRRTARALLADVPPLVTGVLVTMPTSVQHAVRQVDFVGPDAVQVHDGLSPEEIDALSERVDADVIAAVRATHADVAAFAGVADALLLDAKDAAGGGGTGRTTDWEHARDIVDDREVPVLLAGGLTGDNVAAAVEAVQPYGVDVASGVERADPEADGQAGRKDHDAVVAFVENAKRADREVPA